jgi:hypothetical protein
VLILQMQGVVAEVRNGWGGQPAQYDESDDVLCD